jgi:hypothetical protein
MNSLISTFSLFILLICVGISAQETERVKTKSKVASTAIVLQAIPDTLDKSTSQNIQIDSHKIDGQFTINTNDNKLEKNLPWIVAAFISLTTLMISFLQGKGQTKLVNKQIETSSSYASKQIESDTEIAINNIKATVLSANRQDWITALRNEITEFLFCFIRLQGMKFDNQMEIENGRERVHGPTLDTQQIDKIMKHKLHIELLINPKEDDHKQFIAVLNDSVNGLSQKDIPFENIQANVVKESQSILKREWERVKSLK